MKRLLKYPSFECPTPLKQICYDNDSLLQLDLPGPSGIQSSFSTSKEKNEIKSRKKYSKEVEAEILDLSK